MATAAEPVLAPDPVAALTTRLGDPAVTAALNDLLDHADLIAILVVGLSGLVSRGDTIADSLAEGVGEWRTASAGTLPSAEEAVQLVQRLTALSGPLVTLLPAIERLMTSDLADPRMVDIASLASRAAMRGASEASVTQARVPGLRALLRALKDDDVSRALGLVISVARALGHELRRAEPAGH